METQGLVAIDGGIRLPDDCLQLAETVVRRHRLAERFLTEVLGLSWAEAHPEAGRWEHVISERVEEAMVRLLGDPTTCPHGNPIPGSSSVAPDSVSLDQLAVGATFTVTRIPEELEFAPGIRDDGDENYDGVAAVMEGTPGLTRLIRAEPGTLALFRGRRALHRVTRVSGARPRIMMLLSFDEREETVWGAEAQRRVFGRAAGEALVP